MLLQLFGTFAAQVGGQPLPPLRSRKGHWLLALLALRRGEEMERASLAGLLWPDSSHTQALYNLRRALAELREVMGSDGPRFSSPNPHTLALDLAGVQVDVVAFDEAITRGDEASLESAVALYRGPLLEGCHEEWISSERGAREEAYLNALETLAARAAARDDSAAAVRHLQQAVAVDWLRESAQQALLKALVVSGDSIGALMAYRAFRLRLHQEVRAEPSPETKALFHQLRARARRQDGPAGVTDGEGTVRAAGRAHGRPTEVRAAASAPRRLPRPLSHFVGRETALHTVEACLESSRLVTLTGPGGVGKTRLAIQVADTIADDHLDGVWFVDLGRLSDPALVPQAVASVLAVREQPDRPLMETLAEFLRPKQLLLVLDNCEHLLPACAELVEALLSDSREMRVLATSRQSLGLTGEVAWQLPGLSVPPVRSTAGSTPEALLQFEAVRLFTERGVGVTATFTLTERNARSVAEICRRLDGIPLAIELAAARLKALSVEEIAARLDDRFRLLTGGSRTSPPRQQTLQATMDWSYELLSEPERLLFQQLSVFTGSFSLQAVEGVCGRSGVGCSASSDRFRPSNQETPNTQHRGPTVLDLLTQLVDQSLVVVERADGSRQMAPGADASGTRYHLLETVRQYAQERLRTGAPPSGESEAERVRRRHLEYYLRLAEEAGPYVGGQDQAVWLERLETERDNLRTALDWALACAPEPALRLATALVGFWIEHRHLEEGRHRLAAALEGAGPARRSPTGAWALIHLGWLAFLGDDVGAARPSFEESLAIWRELGDPGGVAHALWSLGNVARRQEQYVEARALHEESVSIRRTLGNRHGMANSLIGLGETLQEQGADPSTWASYYEEALAIRREIDDRPGVAAALGQLANVAWRQGDYAQAREYREESLILWRSLGSRAGVIHSFGALGHVARDEGNFEEARAFYTQSLLLRWELGDRFTLVRGLEDFAELAAREEAWARTTRLLGATRALREQMANPLQPRERAEYERYLSGARAALGETATSAEWEAGQAMSLEQAIAFALESNGRP